ncbi:unnamed protein product, partial [Medioppia subpectinata]
VFKKNSKPTFIRLYFTNRLEEGSEAIEIPVESLRQFPAGSTLSGVHFKAFGCDESEIDLHDYEHQTLSISLEEKPAVIRADGMLPNIWVHTDASEKRVYKLTWKQAKKDIDIEFFFLLQPYADSPQRMEIKTDSHPKVFPIGQTVSNALHIKVLDAYNNPIRSKDIMDRLVIKPVSQLIVLDERCLKKAFARTDNTSAEGHQIEPRVSFVISNIRLLPNTTITSNESHIGSHKLSFAIRNIDDMIQELDIDVVNGTPHSLVWIDSRSCLSLTNNKRFRFEVQVLDEFKNPVVNTKLEIKLTLVSSINQMEFTAETDSDGVAVFSRVLNYKPDAIVQQCQPPAGVAPIPSASHSQCFGFTRAFATAKHIRKALRSNDQWIHVSSDNKNTTKSPHKPGDVYEKREKKILKSLRDLGENLTGLDDEINIDQRLDACKKSLTALRARDASRTVRGIDVPKAPNRNGVIGRIAHLAYVEDNALAKSISWFLRDFMSCIVTKTTESAQRLCNTSAEVQQTLPLDCIQKSLTLPTLPTYGTYVVKAAKHYLKYNEKSDNLNKVFDAVLGNSIIMEDIESAKIYRHQLILRSMRCPTIITKTGILYESGIIDRQTTAGDIVMFQSPPDPELIKTGKIARLLQQLVANLHRNFEESMGSEESGSETDCDPPAPKRQRT